MKFTAKNRLMVGVSALALIVAGCNADSGDNLGMNNDTEVVVVDENAVDEETRGERKIREIDEANDNDPATRTK